MRVTDIQDFDYLIFENRNRDYGAYQLRRKYNSSVIAGILIAVTITCAGLILPFVINPSEDHVLSGGSRFVQVRSEVLAPPPEQIFVPPPPPPPMTKAASEVVKYIPPVIVDTVYFNDPAPVTTDEALTLTDTDIEETINPGYGEEMLGTGEGTGIDEPFFIVEVMPTFRGGDINEFRRWVQLRTNYPAEAQEKKIQGRVSLTFIVEPDGSVTNVTIVKGIDPLIDNEAIKAVEASPKWSPGLQRGQPVRVRFLLWLNFMI